MGTRKKDTEFLGPAAFAQFTMPFWEAVLETDTPEFVFQPVKAMALGQIQAAALFNRRCLACLELPQKLAACRTPDDFFQVQQSFLQDALRDYSETVNAMVGAFDNAAANPKTTSAKPKVSRDYLPLPNAQPESEEMSDDGTEKTPDAIRENTRDNSQLNGGRSRVRP